MTIDGLFSAGELAKMLEVAEQERTKARENGESMKRCYFYSRILDRDYRLTQRFINQFDRYRKYPLDPQQITTITELADYLKISRSTISRPIKAKMKGRERDYKDMIQFYKSLGGSRGGKNGDKSANFKSSGNS